MLREGAVEAEWVRNEGRDASSRNVNPIQHIKVQEKILSGGRVIYHTPLSKGKTSGFSNSSVPTSESPAQSRVGRKAAVVEVR